MRRGSLTIFLSLVMVAVMTLLFAMSECIRVVAIGNMAQEYTDMALESAFSEYNPYLWTNYKILAIDLGYGTENIGPGIFEGKVAEYAECNSNIEEGYNYCRLAVADCQASNYGLITDGNGQVVVNLGIQAAKDGLGEQVVDSLLGQIDSLNGIEKVEAEKEADSGKRDLDNARRENAEAKYRADTDKDPNTSSADYPDPGSVEDDPFNAYQTFKDAMSKGILSLIVDTNSLSDVNLTSSDLPSARSNNVGNLEVSGGDGPVDKALFLDYLITNYSRYNGEIKHDGLQYEIEYLISGNESDVQNLASVVEQIFLVREAANYRAILNNDLLEGQAAAVADILAGFTMNYAIIRAVKYALIGLWAFAESILDLRQILAGGKVPLIKNVDQWTSDLYGLSQIADINFKAKESDNGIGYTEYLLGLLALKSNSTLGMRAIDVMENALSQTEDYKDVKMDNMLYAASVSIGFSSNEMLTSLLDSSKEGSGYYFSKKRLMTY